jgi:23S rRNA A1618 N6-methylase RlmF
METHEYNFVLANPPNYESVDVVQEFSNRLQHRKNIIYEKFNKEKECLKKNYDFQLKELENDEKTEIAELQVLYLDWLKDEPIKTSTIPKEKTLWERFRIF